MFKTAESPRVEKTERPIDSLISRAEKLAILNKELNNADIDNAAEILDQAKSQFVQSWPTELQATFNEIQTELSNDSSENDPDTDNLIAELITTNPDLLTMISVENMFTDLAEKHTQLASLGTKPSSILKSAAKALSLDEEFLTSNTSEIKASAFSVTLLVQDEVFERKGKVLGQRGTNFRGIPFNIVRANLPEDEQNQIIQHENIHNLFEGVAHVSKEGHQHPLRILQNELKKPIDQRVPAAELAKYCLNGLHSEMLAELKNAEEKGIQPKNDREVNNSFAGIHFTTASRWAKDFYQTIEQETKEIKNKLDSSKTKSRHKKNKLQTIQYQTEVIQHFSQLFTKNVTKLLQALDLAKKLHQDAHDFAHIVAVLIRPSQYYLMEKILLTKYPKIKMPA